MNSSGLPTILSVDNLEWKTVSNEWQGSFIPKIKGEFSQWPSLTDLIPWQHSGIELKRTWPIDIQEDCLRDRWAALLNAEDKNEAIRDSGDRNADKEQYDLFDPNVKLPAISKLPNNAEPRTIIQYSFRTLDRQYLLADNRLISRPRPQLWKTLGSNQLFLVSLFNHPLGYGPAMSVCHLIPDRHYFRGSYGGKDVLPLYRNSAATEANLLPGLLELLKENYGKKVSPEDFAGYIYAILAQPEYTSRFEKELASCQIHVPLTKDGKLFFEVADLGQSLIWLHTYAQRMTNKSCRKGKIPKGIAKCKKAVSDKQDNYPEEYSYDESTQTLFVGDGSFGPISKEIYEFEVSGLKVVQSWLGYRMKKRSGRKSSPLDDIRPKSWTYQFTHELLELLWVLEKTIEGYSAQIELFDKVLESELFLADELPEVPKEMRKAPRVKKKTKQICFGFE